MKSLRISFFAVVAAVACFAFTTKKTIGTGTLCNQTLFYFPVLSTVDKACGTFLKTDFDYSEFSAGNNDATPEAGEIPEVVISDDQPYGCDDTPTQVACAVGYTASQLEKDVNGIWKPKLNQTPGCCIRREILNP